MERSEALELQYKNVPVEYEGRLVRIYQLCYPWNSQQWAYITDLKTYPDWGKKVLLSELKPCQ